MQSLYIFGWPSDYGGADTKLAHLLKLLHADYQITVVSNWDDQLNQTRWTKYMDLLGVRYIKYSELPEKLEGVGFALCNKIFLEGRYKVAKERGLRIVWSSEMMWHFGGEKDIIKNGFIDKLLYVSELQRRVLNYESFSTVPTAIVGNWIDPTQFQFRVRQGPFTIGRLSRADPDKYPEDFPVFYESLAIPKCHYRVMAWSRDLSAKYAWHYFGEQWTLLQPNAQSAADFLHSLDLFVYPLGHRFTESWGRSTVEAMLCGVIPLAPPGHHLDEIIEDGKSGFICADFMDYKSIANELYHDTKLRQNISIACRERAEQLNNPEHHRQLWLEALNA